MRGSKCFLIAALGISVLAGCQTKPWTPNDPLPTWTVKVDAERWPATMCVIGGYGVMYKPPGTNISILVGVNKDGVDAPRMSEKKMFESRAAELARYLDGDDSATKAADLETDAGTVPVYRIKNYDDYESMYYTADGRSVLIGFDLDKKPVTMHAIRNYLNRMYRAKLIPAAVPFPAGG